MTAEQRRAFHEVQQKLNECREILDYIRFKSDEEMSDEDFATAQNTFDYVCKALDQL